MPIDIHFRCGFWEIKQLRTYSADTAWRSCSSAKICEHVHASVHPTLNNHDPDEFQGRV